MTTKGEKVTAETWLAIPLLIAGAGFFIAGAVGLLRLPDVYTRLHALTKVDNLGLGLLLAGLAVQAESWFAILEMGLIWLLVLISSASASHLVARAARRAGLKGWTQS